MDTKRIGPQARAELLAIAPDVHGALDYAELARRGIKPADVIDFSENSNPYGPSPRVREVLAREIAGAAVARYPDRESLALRRALAEHVGAPLDGIVVGNGAAEIIWLVCFAWLRADDAAVVCGPTFGEYARMARLMGAQVIDVRAPAAAADWALSPEQVSETLAANRPRLCFICRPNNPTGHVTPLPLLRTWAERFPQTLFVVDEAYLDFAPGLISAHALQLPNVLVMRSMTKAYALAGLRLGYALGTPQVIDALRAVRVPWSVNGLAQAAGLAALADQAFVQRTLAALAEAKQELVAGLRAVGRAPLDSATHYLLLNVGNGAALRRRLFDHGLLVRDCASFGLPAFIRVATHLPRENARLIEALGLEATSRHTP